MTQYKNRKITTKSDRDFTSDMRLHTGDKLSERDLGEMKILISLLLITTKTTKYI